MYVTCTLIAYTWAPAGDDGGSMHTSHLSPPKRLKCVADEKKEYIDSGRRWFSVHTSHLSRAHVTLEPPNRIWKNIYI